MGLISVSIPGSTCYITRGEDAGNGISLEELTEYGFNKNHRHLN